MGKPTVKELQGQLEAYALSNMARGWLISELMQLWPAISVNFLGRLSDILVAEFLSPEVHDAARLGGRLDAFLRSGPDRTSDDLESQRTGFNWDANAQHHLEGLLRSMGHKFCAFSAVLLEDKLKQISIDHGNNEEVLEMVRCVQSDNFQLFNQREWDSGQSPLVAIISNAMTQLEALIASKSA